MQISRMITGIKATLGFPALQEGIILEAIYSEIQLLLLRIKNDSAENILLRHFSIAFVGSDSDSNTLSINQPGFNGAFLITTDPAMYPNSTPRNVPAIRLQDTGLVGAVAGGMYGGTLVDSVAAVVIYKDDNAGWKCNPYPMGGRGAYIIHYVPVLEMETGMDAVPSVPEPLHPMIIITAALKILPLCLWQGMSDRLLIARKAELANQLNTSKVEYYREYELFIREVNEQHSGFKMPFESSPGVWSSMGGNGFGGF